MPRQKSSYRRLWEQNTAEAFFNDPQQPRTQEFLQTYKQRSLL